MTSEKLGYLIGKALGAVAIGFITYVISSWQVGHDLAYTIAILTMMIVYWRAE